MSNDDTLIREVDEELRRDRLRNFWRHGGPWVILAAVLIVVGVAGYEGWNWWTKTQAARSSDQFYAAAAIADGTDFAAAQKALNDVIAQGSGAYPVLAQFREAALLAKNGKTDDAVAAYDALSTSLSNTHLRAMALILAANLLVDKGDVAAVQQRVGGSITPADPLRNAAREMLGLTQYKAGKLDDAMKSFSDIMSDPNTSQDLRNRIQIYILQLLAEGAKPVAPPAADVTVPSAEASSAAPSAAASSEALSAPVSSEASAPVSSEASAASVSSAAPASSDEPSTGIDSTELDVTPPAVLDNSLMSMASPDQPSSATAAPLAISSEAPVTPSVAPVAPSEAPAVSSEAPVASSSAAPLASSLEQALPSSSLAPISSSSP
jgi:hypothetical protein